MTYNWCFIIGPHSGYYQTINGRKTLMNTWYGNNSHSFVLTILSLLVNLLALHQLRAFFLYKSKNLLAILPKCWFCSDPGFSSDWIILIVSLMLDCNKCLKNQKCPHQTPHNFAKFLGHDSCALIEKTQLHWKTCFLQSSISLNTPMFHFYSTVFSQSDIEFISELHLENFFLRT